MVEDVGLLELDAKQARRCEALDRQIEMTREGIAVWHRLLDRRRRDRKLGLHPIPEFRAEADAGSARVRLVRRPPGTESPREREPFRVRSEHEARALLLRCIRYLSDADGERLAFDKGPGDRDEMAEGIAREIAQHGAIAYIRCHAPFVFGIPLAVADG